MGLDPLRPHKRVIRPSNTLMERIELRLAKDRRRAAQLRDCACGCHMGSEFEHAVRRCPCRVDAAPSEQHGLVTDRAAWADQGLEPDGTVLP